MARAAELPFIHLIHCHLPLCLFHLEQLWMTLLAGEYPSVELVAECDRPRSGLITELFAEAFHIMTSCTLGGRKSLFPIVAYSTV